MKVTAKTDLPVIVPSKLLDFAPDSDLLQKPISRKQANRRPRNAGGGVRLRRQGSPAPAKRGSRPETPLLRWKFDDGKQGEKDVEMETEKSPDVDRKSSRKARMVAVSARKLAAGLWRLQRPEPRGNGELCDPSKNIGFGFQPRIDRTGIHSPARYDGKTIDCGSREVSGSRNEFRHKIEPRLHFSNSAMEAATKWDPTSWKSASEDVKRVIGGSKNEHASVISALESELKQARARAHDLETERRLSKTKLERFLKKLTDERSAWRHREHEKLRAAVDDVKRELNRERQNRQRTEIVNSKLVNELADTRLSAKRYLRDYEKERKSRELIEEVCDELAKEIGEDKAEVEALKRESAAMRAEADEERRMLQMAEVWREERVQMKLVDARVALEDKYAQLNGLVAGLEAFLRANAAGLSPEEIRRAETLRRAAASIEIRELVEFKYEPANPDDIFSVFEDLSFEPPEVPIDNRNVYFDDEDEDDESGWETASRLDDDSPVPSVTKTCVTEIVEVGSKRPEKAYSWRPENYKMISMDGTDGGRFSDVDRSSGLSPSGSGEPWSSPESGQWSRGVVQKHSLKSKLLEARMESQKVQLRQVLKQKI